jgi:cyclophilin family peptidyl-prolyl cis-trans isomerase
MNKQHVTRVCIIIMVLIISGCGTQIPTSTNNTNGSKKIDSKESINANKHMEKTTHLPDHKDLRQTYSGAVLHTNKGDITVAFYGEESPITVNNFLNLAESGFYNDTTFHRVIPNFMIQGGDPLSKGSDRMQHGTGGPEYRFGDEFNTHKIVRGSLAMANAGPNTNGSQFFIVTAEETPHLDMRHTNFGYVVEGVEVVTTIESAQTDGRDNPVDPIVITGVTLKK